MNRLTEQTDIAIVGGGAAGLAAAVVAGETLRGSGAGRVVLCEASDRVGRSILATGNGRCNFSNAQLTDEALCDAEALRPFYHNAAFVAQVFAALERLSLFERDMPERESFSLGRSNAVLRFFAEHGLVWREEGEGRLYPLANKASSVLDVLRAAVDAAQVDVRTEFSMRRIARGSGDYLLTADDGCEIRARQVIIAVGGSVSKDLAESLGLSFSEQRPVLGPLAVDAKGKRLTKRLDNIRVKATATLLREDIPLACEQGEALFRSYGLSGIAVFDLSRYAQEGDEVSLDLLPQVPLARTAHHLRLRAERLRDQGARPVTYEDVLRGMVLPKVAAVLCERARVRPDDAYDAEGGEHLARVLHDLRFTVEGLGDVRQCQVERGGIAVADFVPATLETASAPGLYAAGEALDVDAACGGFNLHWAWASGLLAGYMAALAEMSAREEGR